MSTILNNVENILRSASRIKHMLPSVRSSNRGRDEQPSYKDNDDHNNEQHSSNRSSPSTSSTGGGNKSMSSSKNQSSGSSSNNNKKFVPSKEHLSQDAVPFSGDFDFVECLGDHEDFNLSMQQPHRVAFDRQNNLVFVAENRDIVRINVFHGNTLDFLYNFELKEFSFNIDGLEADPKGDGLIILQKTKIQKYSIDGRQKKWATTLDSDMKDFTIDENGTIYCARDSLYSGIQNASVCTVDSSNGSITGNIGKDLNGYCVVQKVSCICLNKDGNICIVNSYTSELTILNTRGKVIGKQQLPKLGMIECLKYEKETKSIIAAYRNGESNAILIAHPNGGETIYNGDTIPNLGNQKGQHKFKGTYMSFAINSTSGQLILANKYPDIGYETVLVFK